MVKDITKYNIDIFRGDTYEANLEIDGYVLGENDIIKYAVKRSTGLEEPVLFEHTITHPFDNVKLKFNHSDTDELEEDTYFYDVQLSIARVDDEPIIKTVLYGELRIKGDVTD